MTPASPGLPTALPASRWSSGTGLARQDAGASVLAATFPLHERQIRRLNPAGVADVTGRALAAAIRTARPEPGTLFRGDKRVEYLAGDPSRALARCGRVRLVNPPRRMNDTAHRASWNGSMQSDLCNRGEFGSDQRLRGAARPWR